jgi:glycerate-2-kinase
VETKYIETFKGSHPRPTQDNVVPGQRIYEILKDSTEEDLVIVLVSGGGSALLCYPESEYTEGAKLYDAFLQAGKTINEINTVRKHLSMLKGGGLAKVAYPATIIGIIFSDVPGDNFQNVASGSTYKDDTTVTDAEKIIKENNLGEYNLIETPKEDKYFENVKNFVLVSNNIAVEAMENKAQDLGFETNIVSTDLYDEVNDSLAKIFSNKETNKVSLAAGEPKVKVTHSTGKGGRNLHMGLVALQNNLIKDENSVFISFASDGMDNTDMAGAIVDMETIKKAESLGLNVKEYAENFDSYNFFTKTGDLIHTGPTDANVSDLMILLKN